MLVLRTGSATDQALHGHVTRDSIMPNCCLTEESTGGVDLPKVMSTAGEMVFRSPGSSAKAEMSRLCILLGINP